METTAAEGIQEYLMSYPIINDRHIEEAMKLEILVPKAKEMIPDGEHEVRIMNSHYIGFIDLVSKNEDGTYDIYDFKYSNNVSNYRNSSQMHLYKYFWERQNPGKEVKNLYFLFVPKTGIRQKKTESLFEFRERLKKDLSTMQPKLEKIEYDPSKVIEFLLDSKRLLEAKTFPLYQDDYLWKFSEYYDYITKGEDYMILPKNERRNISKVEKKTVWLYGKPFSGKTTFSNAFPDPLMLNTDGNVQFVDAPYLSMKDTVVTEGRRTIRTLAWQNFKNTVEELEKKDNDFKTIIVDLLEDLYESCRLYMYDKLGITHESDDSFRAWDKVHIEFLSTIRKLMNLDYENIILISHEDTSKDITKKSGDKITAIKPNLRDKTANKMAGMVHMVARVITEENDDRTLSFKQDEVTFGGGRLTTDVTEISLNYEEFLKVYEEANANAVSKINSKSTKPEESTEKEEKPKRGRKKKVEPVKEVKDTEEVEEETESQEVPEESESLDESDVETTEETPEVEEKPKARTRKRKVAEPVEDTEEESESTEVVEEKEVEAPKRRVRKKAEPKPDEETEEETEEPAEKPIRRTRKKRA